MAATLSQYAKGEDRREVQSQRIGKSIGHEETFAKSITTTQELNRVAREQSAVVARSLRNHGRVARTVSIVVRFDDLTSVSRSQTLAFGVDDDYAIAAIAQALVISLELRQSVRLFGVHVSSFLERSKNPMQLSLGLETAAGDPRNVATDVSREHQVGNEALRDAIDEIREKFGAAALASGSDLKEGGVHLARQRGSHLFGPEVVD